MKYIVTLSIVLLLALTSCFQKQEPTVADENQDTTIDASSVDDEMIPMDDEIMFEDDMMPMGDDMMFEDDNMMFEDDSNVDEITQDLEALFQDILGE